MVEKSNSKIIVTPDGAGLNPFFAMLNFLKDVKLELSRVEWPTKQETTKYTGVVIGLSLVVAAFLGMLDAVFTFLLDKIILK